MLHAKTEQTLVWDLVGTDTQACPACGDNGPKARVVAVKSLLKPHPMLTFVNCGHCATRFIAGYVTPDYGDIDVSDYATRFYIEQGAGVDHLARPAFALAARGHVGRYLEIGCGYGFGVDIAARAFGWDSRGIDPSSIARHGVRDLGIRIEGMHLSPGTEKQVGTFDGIVAMEVIEHVPEPIEFLKTLKAHLSPGGALFMSTPSAAIIDDRRHPVLQAALSPGYHITLFSREGLALAMEAAGFDNVRVSASDTTLIAAGTVGGEPVDIEEPVDRTRFRAYLSDRMDTQKPGGPLWTGLAYRLYKELVNGERYAEAQAVFERIQAAVLESRGIDLDEPRRIIGEAKDADDHLQSGRWPFCLAGLLYLRGVQLINTNWEPERAFPYFLAALDVGTQIKESLRPWGALDGELQAQIQAAEAPLLMCLERLRSR